MTIQKLMLKKNMTKYRLSRDSGIPYTTVNDICNGKTRLEKCSAETVYKLSRELGVTMETLLEPYLHKRVNFELFKSNVCHQLRALGDVAFVAETMENDYIFVYYERGWYPESLYLLAMLDYISRINGIPLCEEYDDLRKCRLQEPIYPAGILSISAVSGTEQAKEQARRSAIPEFIRFNIVESEVRDVV